MNAIETTISTIHVPDEERAKREERVKRSLQSLLDAMYELQEVEQATGHHGLTQRVCLSMSYILRDTMRCAGLYYRGMTASG